MLLPCNGIFSVVGWWLCARTVVPQGAENREPLERVYKLDVLILAVRVHVYAYIIYLFIYLSIYLFIYLSIYLFVCLSIYLFIYLIYLFMCVCVECVDVAVYGQCLWNDVAAAALIHLYSYCLLPIHFEPLRQKVNT